VVTEKNCWFFLATWTIFQCVRLVCSDIELQHLHVCLKLAIFFCYQVSIINSSDLTFIQNFTGEQVMSSNYMMKYYRGYSFINIVSRIYKIFFRINDNRNKEDISKHFFLN